jgi:peroxiredoxin
MTLNQELQAFATSFRASTPAAAMQIMDQANATIEQSGLLELALNTGQSAPDFTLPDAFGKHVRLATLLETGPVVLAFYRGEWCPYCNMELRALQLSLPKIKAHGASLVAISPQQPDHALSLREKHALDYPVLSDAGSHVARAFGLVFSMPVELRELYSSMGLNIPEQNASDTWELPFAATYVIDTDFSIRLAFVKVDYTQRLEPSEIVATLQGNPISVK